MGIISIEKADRLFWIGRYTERVFTTLVTFFDYFDEMIDKDPQAYKKFCEKISIPDIYGNKETFISRYLMDSQDPNSVYSNLDRAYGNAMVMRDEISSHTLGYIQMALDSLKTANTYAPHYDLQQVIDYLHAFWGCVDDRVDDEECRNLMKCGKYLERLDLYLRLEYPFKNIEREYSKFLNRLHRIHFGYSLSEEAVLTEIINMGDGWKARKQEALNSLWNLFEVR